MRRKVIEMPHERLILINMITQTVFLREVVPIFRPELLQASYAKEVAGWVLEFYRQFNTAPGKDIQPLYEQKRAGLRDEDTAENIADFLASISDEFVAGDKGNVQYAITQAIQYFKLRSLELLKDQLESVLAVGDFSGGEQLVGEFLRVERPAIESVDLFRDAGAVASAFLEDQDFLFRFKGAAGQIIGPLNRGDFLAFLAPMKRGKTWWLSLIAEYAAHMGYRVVFVSLEMTKNAMIRRMWQAVVGQPKESGPVNMPRFERAGEKWRIVVDTVERKGLRPEKVKAHQKIFRRRVAGRLRVVSFPSKSLTVGQLNTHLDNWLYYDGFVPDVIIVDYADILAPDSRGEYRHQLDGIWAGLRRTAMERNALVVTASQAEKGTFHSDISETSVAEDIRKLAHVTAMVGLNQTKDEYEKGMMRISQIAIREDRKATKQAVVLQCLDIGRPLLDSRFLDEVVVIDGDEEEETKTEETTKKRRYRD